MELKQGFEWCRKGKYNVQIELGCYEITESTPLLEGFYEEEFEVDGQKKKYGRQKPNALPPYTRWLIVKMDIIEVEDLQFNYIGYVRWWVK